MQKLLPPRLFLLTIGLMLGLRWLWPIGLLVPTPFNWLGLLIGVAGLAVAISSARHFRQIGTNIITFGQPDRLVISGWFCWSRNPMYLGFSLSLLGIALLLGAAISNLVLVVAFVIIVDRWYIAFEERAMLANFGEQYTAYQAQTRRWI
ncbi:methyltransferase [Herpetosiphon gulosus]|uniref:Isoprenylcysteine carboxyl methyltransferase n=1 Tax=Herpetosiphon gulosus TaxID=1973496 RepID=A0ABP9WXA0_9CHLR